MAKLRKPLKGTASMKETNIMSKNLKKTKVSMVNSTGRVSKPKQKKHALKLPDNFKENTKLKNKEIVEVNPKIKRVKKNKNLPADQVGKFKNGSGDASNQNLKKKNQKKTFQSGDLINALAAEIKPSKKKTQKVVMEEKLNNETANPKKLVLEPPKIEKPDDTLNSSKKKKQSKNLSKKYKLNYGSQFEKLLQKKKKTKANTKTAKKTINLTPLGGPKLNEILPPFDEKKLFDAIKTEKTSQLIQGLKLLVQEDVKKKRNQVFTDYRYMLNVTCFKIPSCPKRIVKLKLKHSLVTEDDDVCIIVRDLQRGRKIDFEPTIQHYEDLFREKGVMGVKTIIPFNQLKKEYGSYEMKIKLSNLYDYYLCDGAIVGHVAGFLGTTFQKTKCTVHSVRMNSENLAREIKKSLHKTSYKQGATGTLISIPIGTDKMTPDRVADNILGVISQLKTIYPGGLANIRHLYARIAIKGTHAVPLYISDTCPPEKIPNVIGPRQQKIEKTMNDVNQILRKFQLNRVGDFVKANAKKRKVERVVREKEGKEIAIKQKKSLKDNKAENNSYKKPTNFVDKEESKTIVKKKAKTSKIEEINENPTDEEVDRDDDEVQDEIQDEVKPESAPPQPDEQEVDSTDSTFTDSTLFDTSFSSGSEATTECDSDSADSDDSTGYSDDDGDDDDDDDSEPSIKENGIKEESDEDNENSDADEESDDSDEDEDE